MRDESSQVMRSETRSMGHFYDHLKRALESASAPLGVGKASTVSNVIGGGGALEGMPLVLSGSVIPLSLLGGDK